MFHTKALNPYKYNTRTQNKKHDNDDLGRPNPHSILTFAGGMRRVLSADAFLMKRVPHGDFHPLKYTQKAIYKGEPMSIQALQKMTTAPSYYDVDTQKYREALKEA